jgi:hypothetical protein
VEDFLYHEVLCHQNLSTYAMESSRDERDDVIDPDLRYRDLGAT